MSPRIPSKGITIEAISLEKIQATKPGNVSDSNFISKPIIKGR